jgi:hypothetical protein
MSELLFGFKDLVNTGENTQSIFDIASLIFNDDILKKYNRKRFIFYTKFIAGLSNPAVLERFFHKIKDVKNFTESYEDKIKHFVTLIEKLNANVDKKERDNIILNVKTILKNKYNINEELIDNALDKALKTYGGANEKINRGTESIKEFIDIVDRVAPDIGEKKPMSSVNDLLLSPEKQKEINERQKERKNETIANLRQVYNKYKDNVNPKHLEIKMIDRIIFIATTFIIRFITLMIINWGLSSNLINSFYTAFYYYCIIYLIFFIFITMIVNVIINYPILELFSSNKIVTIPNIFYYFYIYTNGYLRLLLHMFLIILIFFIPYVINIDKMQFSKIEASKPNISFDYDKKKKIMDAISTFSFIIWIITSIIATKF